MPMRRTFLGPRGWLRKETRTAIALGAVLALVGAGAVLLSAQEQNDQDRGDSTDVHPNGRGVGTVFYVPHGRGDLKEAPKAGKPNSGNGIFYHGGPVMLGQANVHYIWYGGWSGNLSGAEAILNPLAQYIDSTPQDYFNIQTSYYQQSGATNSYVNDVVTQAVSLFVTNYPANSNTYSKSLSDNDILAIVRQALGQTTPDAKGVYFVLTSSDVTETSGFCSSYCAWHWSTIANGAGLINGVDVKYAFVGDPARCPSACEQQTAASPNNNPGVDGMANLIAHELDESVNDPDLDAWYDRAGNESADKCAWTFGTVQRDAANGSVYNITLGGLKYLIQRNWVNAAGGYCSMSYP